MKKNPLFVLVCPNRQANSNFAGCGSAVMVGDPRTTMYHGVSCVSLGAV